MQSSFRKRFVLANVAVVLVIALGAATALLALRSTSLQVEQARQIDHRLALIDHLRAESRELGLSARRFILGGDLKEQQRVVSIVQEMKQEREQLGARVALAKGALLEADLDEYIASLMTAMWFDDKDPIVRLSRFEDELVRIRAPLSLTFENIISRERSRRDALRSAHWLAHGARWAVLVASILGAVLVISSVAGVLRKLAPSGTEANVGTPRSVLAAVTSELRSPLQQIIADSTKLQQRHRDPTEANVLDQITRNAARVNALLDAIADGTAVQRSTTGLRREPLETADLVGRALEVHRSTARERGVRLRYEAQPSVRVFADRERIAYVLDSLLGIAIDSARPSAELVVHIAAARGDIRFAIIEPGPGIEPSADYEAVLQLCEQVIEAHGGRLGIQTSSISRTYWFALPTEPSLLR